MINNGGNNIVTFDGNLDFVSPIKLSNSRNSSPNRYSPSDSLSKTTKARIHDSNELEKRRIAKTEIIETKKINRNAIMTPPSEHLMKTTQARIYDMDKLISTKGMIKHEDDPFWEQRKPVDLANNKKFQVDSKLYEPTTATIFYQRKKHPSAIPMNKSTATSVAATSESVQSLHSIKPINPESPLLKKTFNSIIKDVKVPLPSPPPKPTLHLISQSSSLAPSDVTSKLYENTLAYELSKWKGGNKDIHSTEESVTKIKSPVLVVPPPSEHLLQLTKATHLGLRSKAIEKEKDVRETGWSNSYKDLIIPDLEHVSPLRGISPNTIYHRMLRSRQQNNEKVISSSSNDETTIIDDDPEFINQVDSFHKDVSSSLIYLDNDEEAKEILEMQAMLTKIGSEQQFTINTNTTEIINNIDNSTDPETF